MKIKDNCWSTVTRNESFQPAEKKRSDQKKLCQLFDIIFRNSFSSLSKFSSFLSAANAFTLLHSFTELKICLKIILFYTLKLLRMSQLSFPVKKFEK